MVPKTRAELEQLITSGIEESATIEYKDGAALDRHDKAKREITKDVSAFANAAGGVLIYGIAEFADKPRAHLPERIAPVDTATCNREWLDQIVGQIQPRIAGLVIHPVHVGPTETDYCFVVEIPQSATAHQAIDQRYYKRRNFLTEPMEDYEIRDVMNRAKHPKLSVSILIQPAHSCVHLKIRNDGSVMARFFCVQVEFPATIAGKPVVFSQQVAVQRNDKGLSYWFLEWKNVADGPLFPQSEQYRTYNWSVPGYQDGASRPLTEVKIRVYADNMTPETFAKDITAASKSWA